MAVDYLYGYSDRIRDQAWELLERGELETSVLARHPEPNPAPDNARLYQYTQQLKRERMKSSPPLGKVRYCEKIATVNRALGLHTYAVRQQGGKLKRTNEIRIGAVFRELPADFLKMIVVHELAHLRHKDHDKAFYQLCCYLEPTYHQLELELRLVLFARSRGEGT